MNTNNIDASICIDIDIELTGADIEYIRTEVQKKLPEKKQIILDRIVEKILDKATTLYQEKSGLSFDDTIEEELDYC
jgi:hypothetical protein